MIGQPRFNVGDLAWKVITETVEDVLPCPDCKGAKTWTVTTRVGETFEVTCQRCQGSIPRVPPLRRKRSTYRIVVLTIGSVRLDTADPHDGSPWTYMCEETGVRTGQVYYESGLFSDETAARLEGERLALLEQTKIQEKPQQLRAEEMATKFLKVAIDDGWRDELWDAGVQARNLKDAIREFLDGRDVSRLQEELNDVETRRYAWRHKGAWEVLTDAVEAGSIEQVREALAKMQWKPKTKGDE